MFRPELPKLSKADRDFYRSHAFGTGTLDEQRRWICMDYSKQSERDMRAIGLRMGRQAARRWNEQVLAILRD